MRKDAGAIIQKAIAGVLPDEAVRRALRDAVFPGRVILVAAGKAAWTMARTAWQVLAGNIARGIVITKYGHAMGSIGNLVLREAGHPVPDENTFSATREALEMVSGLGEEDTVLFLLSGGGSALFEAPRIPGEELQAVTSQLLASGADIRQINTVRKRLSGVKGGRFALACAPARVFSVVLSDVLGDAADMIASGPACPDPTTCADALAVAERYVLDLSEAARECLCQETPKTLDNVTMRITGSVRQLCAAAARAAEELGYEPRILTDHLDCDASGAGRWLSELARGYYGRGKRIALIAGGETVVHVTGTGKGGRNQELALAAAPGIAGLEGVCVFSVGSDGTDGPTDAAGGYVDGGTVCRLAEQGICIERVLADNDAYSALQKCDGLIITGPTGTNVNDVAVALITR